MKEKAIKIKAVLEATANAYDGEIKKDILNLANMVDSLDEKALSMIFK